MIAEAINNSPVFPDLYRLQLCNVARTAPTIADREHAEDLLTLYDKGKISVHNDPMSGELVANLSEIN
jgi:hypothetical protein